MTEIAPEQARAPLALTLDIGSSSVRTLVFDALGRPLAGSGARAPYDLSASADGASEIDADLLLELAFGCIDATLAQIGPLADAIAVVGVDTLASTFLALNRAGRPLGPLISYADTRNSADSEALRARLDERSAHQRTGCLLRTSYWPARLAWLRRAQPERWAASASFLTIGAYLELQLFGAARTGISPASWTGLLDRGRLGWDAELLEAVGASPAQLGPLADTRELASGLRAPLAARWPALRSTPWIAAVGDGAAANIGSGCSAPGRVALTVGTTGALRVVLPHVAAVPDGLWCYRVDARRALLGGATSEGGNVYAWLSRTLQLGDQRQAEAELAAAEPDAHGLSVLPLWAGERSPGWAGDARAAIAGMTMATRPIDILQASLEAVAYRFALIAEQLLAAEDGGEIVVSGGGLRQSPAWAQIIADTLGRDLLISEDAEATSRGSALLALEAVGAIDDVGAIPATLGARIAPRRERHAIYRRAIERQRQLYRALIAPGISGA